MDTEGAGAHAVEGALLFSTHLESHIKKNDRTPPVDGRIDLHASDSHTNKSLVGRVATQVKGWSVENTY